MDFLDFLDYLLIPILILNLFNVVAGLLITWCWPALYDNRFIAWYFGANVFGRQRKPLTLYAFWVLTGTFTGAFLYKQMLLPGLAMMAVFGVFTYVLRDKLYGRKKTSN